MTDFTTTDHAMMAQALRLAERGAYTTKPNPMINGHQAWLDGLVAVGK